MIAFRSRDLEETHSVFTYKRKSFAELLCHLFISTELCVIFIVFPLSRNRSLKILNAYVNSNPYTKCSESSKFFLSRLFLVLLKSSQRVKTIFILIFGRHRNLEYGHFQNLSCASHCHSCLSNGFSPILPQPWAFFNYYNFINLYAFPNTPKAKICSSLETLPKIFRSFKLFWLTSLLLFCFPKALSRNTSCE